MDHDLIKITEVEGMTLLSRSTIYRLMKAGKFPVQIETSPKTVAWVKAEVEGWICELMKKRKTA